MTSDSARLFLGLELSDEARNALTDVRQRLEECGVQGKLYAAPLYHLTLCFLGNTPRSKIPLISSLMDSLDAEPFSLTLHGTGSFKGSILWAGVQPSQSLMDYQASLAEALRNAGFPLEEGEYRPHITLGRQVKFPVPSVHVPEVSFQVRHATLFESTRIDNVLTYVPLYRSVFH